MHEVSSRAPVSQPIGFDSKLMGEDVPPKEEEEDEEMDDDEDFTDDDGPADRF